MKRILELIQSYEDVRHFRDQNDPFVLNKNFLVQTIVITFIYLLALFIVQSLKTFLQRIQIHAPFLDPKWSIGSRIMVMHHFWTKSGPFAPKKSFFGKLLLSFSSTY